MFGGSLLPFEGVVAPGLYFDSGYAVWFARFSSTPADVGAYSQVWLVDPNGRRALYVDPEGAGPTVTLFHEPDTGCGARAEWDLPAPDVLRLLLIASDETALDLSIYFAPSGTWLLNSLLSAPVSVRKSGSVSSLVEGRLAAIFGKGTLRLAGKTETGRAYMIEPKRVAAVRAAQANLNGMDLGRLKSPPRPIQFGDLRIPERPGVLFGTMHLQYTAWRGNLRRLAI